jgi:hypothetical protein
MTILEPLIAKSMKVRGYSRIEATQRAERWLAGELGVPDLRNLNFVDEWTAAAIVERALLPPPKKHKMKMVIPEEVQQYLSCGVRNGDFEKQWLDPLKAEWGEEFFNMYFGITRGVDSNALLSPGQVPQESANRMALIEA